MIDVIRDNGRLVGVHIHHRNGVTRLSVDEICVLATTKSELQYYVKQILKENLRMPLEITNEMAWEMGIGTPKSHDILNDPPSNYLRDYCVLWKRKRNQPNRTEFVGRYEIKTQSGDLIPGVFSLSYVGTQFPAWQFSDLTQTDAMDSKIQSLMGNGFKPMSDKVMKCGNRTLKLWSLVNSIFADRSVG